MDNDKLVDAIYSAMNKKYGSNQSIFRLTDQNSPVVVKDWITTGCTPLDIIISNRMARGIPVGRITVINGLKSTGKSLLLATILANAQKQGALSVFIDNEFAVDSSFYEAVGVNLNSLVYLNLEYIEDILASIEEIIIETRKVDKDRLIVIGIDSIAAAKTKQELKEDYDKSGYNTHKAIILSQKLPRIIALLSKFNVALICTQQLRTKLGIMFGDPYVSASGGLALDFYASLIIRLKQLAKIKSKDGLIVGTKIKAVIEKNRMAPPYREAEFEIYFDSGIDDSKSCLEMLEKYGAVEGKVAKKIVSEELKKNLSEKGLIAPDETFKTSEWRNKMQNESFYDEVSKELARLNIMKYRGHMGSDNIELETTNDE